jgi:hypothetical protein
MANSFSGNTYRVDTSGLVRTGGGRIQKIQLVSGIDAATSIVRDGLTGTDPIIDQSNCPPNDIRGSSVAKVTFFKGLFVTLTGTAPVLFITIV